MRPHVAGSLEVSLCSSLLPSPQPDKGYSLMVASIASLRLFSGVGLVLALLLASLGPLASAYRSRPLVRSQIIALISSMLMAVCVVIWASNYLVPFVFQTP